jgi:predicted nucleotidyltransferase
MDKATQVYKKINHMPTSQAIDALSKEWLDRKPPKGIRKEKYIVTFEKGAGILDPKKDKMDPSIWTKNGKRLKPNIKKHIMTTILSYVPKKAIKQVVLIGSLTGLQYKENSDLDINVMVDPPELVKELWEIRRSKNESIVPGTKHPLNIFLVGFEDDIPIYQDSHFGVYDVVYNKWLVDPPPSSSYRNPKDKFWAELVTARMYAKEFMRRADNLEKSKHDLMSLNKSGCMCAPWKIPTAKNRVKRDLEELMSFLGDLNMGRKFAYRWGWGVPRIGYRNILYKFVHKWLPIKYKAILEELEELKQKSNEEHGSAGD